MRNIELALVPLLISIAFWLNLLLPLGRRQRGLVMLPFVLAAIALLFWELRAPISGDLEFALGMLGSVSLFIASVLTIRRARRESEAGA